MSQLALPLLEEPTSPAAIAAPAKVKAISLWEPWASLMRTTAKKIETRSWWTGYRGPLLICSSRRRPNSEELWLLRRFSFSRGLAPLVGKPIDWEDAAPRLIEVHVNQFYFGHAVALVDLVDCRRMDDVFIAGVDFYEREFGMYQPGRYAWITANPRVFHPFAVRGHQGLFEELIPAGVELRPAASLWEAAA